MKQDRPTLQMDVAVENWPFKEPFSITGHTMLGVDVVVVTLMREGCLGRGEAAGVYYLDDTVSRMRQQLETVRPAIEAGISREELVRLLPRGGARNAVDCALWDLESKVLGRPAWQIAGIDAPRPLTTIFTCGAGTPDQMASTARAYKNARAIKLKLTGEAVDADRVRAVRESMPHVWLGVDANQGFDRASLERLMPTLTAARVALIEQPFPRGQEALLNGFRSPIPIAADESVQDVDDLPGLVNRFDIINIKLDKCGGLTQGLALASAAEKLGFGLMVGNMLGTSLAMAPAMLLGQRCRIVDLDGPVFLQSDRAATVHYEAGMVWCPESVWGASRLGSWPRGAGETAGQ